MKRTEPRAMTTARIGQIAVLVASAAILGAIAFPVVSLVAAGIALVLAQDPRVPLGARVLVWTMSGVAVLAVALQVAMAIPFGATDGTEVVVPA